MEKIYKICGSCQGTGITPGSAGLICPQCDGDKIHEWGYSETLILEELVTQIDAIAERIGLMDGKLDDILAKVNPLTKCKHME